MSGGLDNQGEAPSVEVSHRTMTMKEFLNVLREEYAYALPRGFWQDEEECAKRYLEEAISNTLARFVSLHD